MNTHTMTVQRLRDRRYGMTRVTSAGPAAGHRDGTASGRRERRGGVYAGSLATLGCYAAAAGWCSPAARAPVVPDRDDEQRVADGEIRARRAAIRSATPR